MAIQRFPQLSSVCPSRVAEAVLHLDGQPFSLKDYPFWPRIFDTDANEVLLLTGRQVAKTTSIAALVAVNAITMPLGHQVVVLPLQEQADIFSVQRLQPFLTRSPIVEKFFFSGVDRIDQVRRKQLTNGHLISIGYAQRVGDRLRGQSLKAGSTTGRPILAFDEVQDIFPEVLPTVKELANRVPTARYFYAGTPKSTGNHAEALRDRSTGCEWAVRCEATGCKKWNLEWDERNIGNTGVICRHCGSALLTNGGQWVAARKLDPERGKDSRVSIEGYRIPQLIIQPMMTHPGKWRELLGKLRDYSTAQFHNEVLGLPAASGSVPIELSQLEALCCSDRPNVIPDYPDPKRGPLVMGVDWAFEGINSFTVIVLGSWAPFPTKFDVYYWRIFKGSDINPKVQIAEIADLAKRCNVQMLGCDYGCGQVQNIELIDRLGENRVAQLFHTGMIARAAGAQRVRWEPKTRKWHLARTRVMTDTFNDLRGGRISFPRAEECTELFEHILSVTMEYREESNTFFYSHVRPDDSFHALVYAQLAGELACQGDFRGNMNSPPAYTFDSIVDDDVPDSYY